MDPLVQLAKDTIKYYLESGKDDFLLPDYVTDEMLDTQTGVFVSLHLPDGSLRGCIGTIGSTQPNLALEIVANAISASTRDPRFAPVSLKELAGLDIGVDVLSDPEKIDSINELDPRRFGVIVEKGNKRGLLLPDLDGVNSVQEQLDIAMRKAGILDGLYGCDLYRFTVTRHH